MFSRFGAEVRFIHNLLTFDLCFNAYFQLIFVCAYASS